MISLFGIGVIASLVAFALHKGIDGVALSIGLTIIGGLAGYSGKALKDVIGRWLK